MVSVLGGGRFLAFHAEDAIVVVSMGTPVVILAGVVRVFVRP